LNKTFAIAALLLLGPVFGDVSKAASGGAVEPNKSHNAVVVSLNRVASESAEGRAANQRLQALAQKMQTDLAAKQKELPPGSQDFQRLVQQSATDFTTAQRQVQTEMRAKVNAVVAEIAAQRGVDMVFNSDTLVWSATQLDITGEVVSKLDALSKATAGK
jgi:Skp family chaperone for outer membrane proteins